MRGSTFTMTDPDDDELFDEAPPPTPTLKRGQEPIELTVRIKAEGMRLDHYLHLNFQDFSRSDLQEGIRGGTITVNGKASKPSFKVRNHDVLKVVLPEPDHPSPVAEDIPLDILYEDEFLAVVNKPWNMVVHPAKGNWSGTLVNALQFHFRGHLSQANGSHRPGIVHRLDKDTSGAILIGKEEQTHRELAMMFEHRKMFKEYVAICGGELDRDSDYIEAAMKMHPHDRLKQVISKDADAKEAVSYYEVMERFRGFTMVKVQPKTGRTHQIRVHLAHVGCPVLADKLYGGRSAFRLSEVVQHPLETDELLLERQSLHAFRLRFKHPRTGNWLEVEAPFPPDMRRTLEALREHRKL